MKKQNLIVKNSLLLVSLSLLAVFVVGCGQQSAMPADPSTATEGTLKMKGLTAEQQIEKVKNDPQIPDQHKQIFENSMKQKAGSGSASPAPGSN